MSDQLQQGDERRWFPGVDGIDGTKIRICGLATNGVPVLGISYIVELLEPIPGTYYYTHAAAFAAHLK